jgi:hypothetical protein
MGKNAKERRAYSKELKAEAAARAEKKERARQRSIWESKRACFADGCSRPGMRRRVEYPPSQTDSPVTRKLMT